MNKIYLLLFTALIPVSMCANPIVLPSVEISELYFDDAGNWKLELEYLDINQSNIPIDSILIYSTTDSVKLRTPTNERVLPPEALLYNGGIFVVTNDSLDSDFEINRYDDKITVVSYAMGVTFEDLLIYGNLSGTLISCPKQGQSISKYRSNFVKDNTPTIGESNDTTGICGTLKGIVYDKFSVPVQNQIFNMDFDFITTSSGEYFTRVCSKPSTFNRISYKTDQYPTQSITITEISYIMEPDSVIELDIYLLDTLLTGVHSVATKNSPITIYPNPVSIDEKINIKIDLPSITSNICIEIVDLNGKLIRKEKIIQMENLIDTPAKSGLYLMNVWLDSEIISSRKIVVND